MTVEDTSKTYARGFQDPGGISPTESAERHRAVALGLELSKRAHEASSLDELFFILTNDLRALMEFDRALLITHIKGESKLSAASNQPALDKKFPIHEALGDLPASLSDADRGVLLSGKTDAEGLSGEGLPSAARTELLAYAGKSGCAFLFSVPLTHNKIIIGHLLLEFFGDTIPRRAAVLTVLSIAPLLGAALAEKWFLEGKLAAWEDVFVATPTEAIVRNRRIKISAAAGAGVALLLILLVVPFRFTVGGEAEVFLHDRHLAFTNIEGTVDRINVKEGSPVEKGQVLAVLDPKDLEHETGSVQRRVQILTGEMMLLRREAGQDPSKLAESELVKLKRASAGDELEYLKWKAQFLEIKAPVSGVVVTKEVDSLVGKRFKAGEAFCEIASAAELWVGVFVPEDRISLVHKGQHAEIYLNTEPGTGYPAIVEEIAPIAQVLPRLGNVFRVSAPFRVPSGKAKVGMRGLGKIDTERTSLFNMLKQRLLERWNHYSIYF